MTYVESHMAASLAGHVLELHVDTPEVKGWYLKRPGAGRMMSTLLLFTREGIVILGDLCPGNRGVISAFGYGEGWFASRLSENYLCEKFLRKEFALEKAIEELRERIIGARREGVIDKARARDAMDSIGNGVAMGPESVSDIFDDAGLSDIEDLGHGYNPADAGWLCAIQQRFAVLRVAAVAGGQ